MDDSTGATALRDSGPNGLNATLAKGPTTSTAGLTTAASSEAASTAVRLDGAAAFSIPNQAGARPDPQSGAFTHEAWVKPDTPGYFPILENYKDGAFGPVLRINDAGNWQFLATSAWSQSAGSNLTSSAQVTPGQTYHGVATYSGGDFGSFAYLWVNGEYVGRTHANIEVPWGVTSTPIRIGGRGDDGAGTARGTIDNVAIY